MYNSEGLILALLSAGKELALGTFVKILTWLFATAAYTFVTYALCMVGTMSETLPRMMFAALILWVSYSYFRLTRHIYKVRCVKCGSWNVWRNYNAISEPDKFDPRLWHMIRRTKCHTCKHQFDFDRWQVFDEGKSFYNQ